MTARINGARAKSLVLLDTINFVENGRASVKVFQDLIVKKFLFITEGNLIWTGDGSGTLTKPVIRPYGISDGLFEEVVLSRKSSDKVRAYKGVRHLCNTHERMNGQKDPAIYKSNAADLSGTFLEGLPVFPATTQKMPFREAQSILMENGISDSPYTTLFSTKDLSTSTINFKFKTLSNVRDPEGTSTAPITSDGITIKVYAVCADYLLESANIGKIDFVQVPEEVELAGAQAGAKHFISPEGLLQGMYITGTHSNGKPFDMKDMEGLKLEISYLGVDLWEGSMLDMQDADNLETLLMNRKKGTCYVNFRDSGMLQSGLPIVENKKLQIKVTTGAGISYPAVLTFEYDQLIFDPALIPRAV